MISETETTKVETEALETTAETIGVEAKTVKTETKTEKKVITRADLINLYKDQNKKDYKIEIIERAKFIACITVILFFVSLRFKVGYLGILAAVLIDLVVSISTLLKIAVLNKVQTIRVKNCIKKLMSNDFYIIKDTVKSTNEQCIRNIKVNSKNYYRIQFSDIRHRFFIDTDKDSNMGIEIGDEYYIILFNDGKYEAIDEVSIRPKVVGYFGSKQFCLDSELSNMIREAH